MAQERHHARTVPSSRSQPKVKVFFSLVGGERVTTSLAGRASPMVGSAAGDLQIGCCSDVVKRQWAARSCRSPHPHADHVRLVDARLTSFVPVSLERLGVSRKKLDFRTRTDRVRAFFHSDHPADRHSELEGQKLNAYSARKRGARDEPSPPLLLGTPMYTPTSSTNITENVA